MRTILSIVLVLFSLNTLAKENYIFLGLDNFEMSKNSNSMLVGSVIAHKIHFIYDNQNIEINAQEHRLYEAATVLFPDRLEFNNEFLKFSTPLDADNPMYLLDTITAQNTDITVDGRGAIIDSQYLDFSLNNIFIAIKNAHMDCVSDTGFNMNVDETCLQNSTTTKLGDNDSVISINSMDDKVKASLDINLTKVKVDKHLIAAWANELIGRYNEMVFTLGEGFLSCYKIDQQSLDPISFYRGCMIEAVSKARMLRFQNDLYNFEVDEAHLDIKKDSYHLDAAYSRFETPGQVTRASKFKLDCMKLQRNGEFDPNMILKGCFKQGDLSIAHLDSDGTKKQSKEVDKDIIDTDNLKDVKLIFSEDRFSMSAKSKVILRLMFRVNGRTEWAADSSWVKFHILKASMARFPATKMTMKILAKFINSDRMSVDGNTITINF
jgi:hypothetical protein